MTNPTINPQRYWAAVSFINYSSPLPMIELDLRLVTATGIHQAEAIACRQLIDQIGKPHLHIICALARPEQETPATSPEQITPASAPPQREIFNTVLAKVRQEIANNVGQLAASVPRGGIVQLSAPTYKKLMTALANAGFAASDEELRNVATTLLGRPVTPKQTMKEAEGRGILAFLELEGATSKTLDILFPPSLEVVP